MNYSIAPIGTFIPCSQQESRAQTLSPAAQLPSALTATLQVHGSLCAPLPQ